MTTTRPITTEPMTTEPKKIECNDTNKDLEGCKIKEKLDDVLRKLHRCHVRDQLFPLWIVFLIFIVIMLVIWILFGIIVDIGLMLLYSIIVFILAIVGWSELTKGTRHKGGHDKKEEFEKEKERLINLLNKDYPNIDKLTHFGKSCHTKETSNDESGGICDGKAYYWGRTIFLVGLILFIFPVVPFLMISIEDRFKGKTNEEILEMVKLFFGKKTTDSSDNESQVYDEDTTELFKSAGYI